MKDCNTDTDVYKNLINVGYYVAPGDRKIPSFTIPLESEYIEIITGGKVFFEFNNQMQTFSKGAIFWHLGGEGTIHQTPPDDPYRCLVLRFEVKSRLRVLPRVTQWHNEQSVMDFYQEALRCFHDDSYDRNVLGRYLYNRVFWEAYCYSLRKDIPEYPLPVRRAMTAIDNFPNGDFPIHDLADMI
ncbi:MAG: hypothetical protein ACYC4Q_02525, partial [Victivallaceae bacterium]